MTLVAISAKQYHLTCKECGVQFSRNDAYKASYCSGKCKREFFEKQRAENNRFLHLKLSSGEVGQICESAVTADLIKKGWKVFKPFDTTCAFDLLIYKDRYVRVQVKAGRIAPNGRREIPRLSNDEHEVLAVVYNLSEIVYYGESV